MTDHLETSPNRTVDLDIGGMTCASCAIRIEKKLNKLDGVQASVNLALETARVQAPEQLPNAALVSTVEKTGYRAAVTSDGAPARAGSTAGTAGIGDAGSARSLAHGSNSTDSNNTGSNNTDSNSTGSNNAGSDNKPDAGAPSRSGGSEHDEAATDKDPRGLKKRLVASVILAVPVLAISMVPPWQFTGWEWVVGVLTLPVAVWGAWPFHAAAGKAARTGGSTMDTLVSIGIMAATVWSVWALAATTVAGRPFAAAHVYFEVAAVVTVFLLAGRLAEASAKRRATSALKALLAMGAKDVAVVDAAGREQRIPIERLGVGDEFVVRPGEKVATDGVVTHGNSAIDESMLTGESVPVEASEGSAVTGATMNTSGRLLVRATRVGSETTLAQMSKMVADAQTGKAPAQRLADRVSSIFVPTVLIVAAVTVALWLLITGDPGAAFTAGVAVLIVACPCALGLATPTALAVGSGRGSQLGIVIRGPEVLESTRTVDTIMLDKTGTVTEGRMSVARAALSDDALRLVRAAESGSEHPIARAIVDYADDRLQGNQDAVGTPADFANTAGGGVSATVDGHAVLAGRPGWLAEQGIDHGIDTGSNHEAGTHQAEAGTHQAAVTRIAVAVDGSHVGDIDIADRVKDGANDAVAQFLQLGLHPVLLTGDNEHTARSVAAQVGITDVVADVRPEDKATAVGHRQAAGAVVAMVGDGVNDAAALATADLGLAMGTGTDVAIEAGDLTLVRGDLRVAASAVRLARRTLGIIKGNLFWAFAYNAAAIPLAAFGLLNPMVSGLAMAFSSVFVVLNSLRLYRFR